MNPTAATFPKQTSRGFAPGLVFAVSALALTLLGLVVLSSAGQESNADPLFFFKRQCIFFGPALLVGLAAALVDLDQLRKYTWVVAVLAVGLLVAVLIPHIGVSVNGARRWLDFKITRVQPSDAGKLALVLCLAHYLGANQRHIRTFWRGFAVPMGIIGIFAALIIKEPDFGTTALCAMVGCTLLFLAGVRLWYLIPSMLAGGSLFGLMVYLDPVRLRRIVSFLDLEANKSDGSYQLWQGILAFGAGGVSGVGLGQGRQQQAFLPEAHTDFVLAVVGEEMGLIATAGVVLTFLVMFVVGYRSLRRAPNLYEFTLGCGLLLLLTGQALVNIGVVTGRLPTKGMSLPFISYGGSNLILMFAIVGLLINCFRRWDRPVLPSAREI